ncbi:hypothetical protein [Sanguibacter massiliensis]|uniref:hypothetical protein n=1 Tax=Sanguibacter massiliensis TaxID=1973217 RepID=UPI00101AE626|nr:hypothetical protein [Sanguibacter massiliensis]
MRRGAKAATMAAVVITASLGYVAATSPFTDEGDTLSSAAVLNRAQVERIDTSPNKGRVALPAAEPPLLEFVQAVRTKQSASEVHFQERGTFVVVCRGIDDADSACDAETATVFRDEDVNGQRVRVAWIASDDATAKVGQVASDDDRAQIEQFWVGVDLQLGMPAWLYDFA